VVMSQSLSLSRVKTHANVRILICCGGGGATILLLFSLTSHVE
jgi:hypothetical protein